MNMCAPADFAQFRTVARRLIAGEVHPSQIFFTNDELPSLFQNVEAVPVAASTPRLIAIGASALKTMESASLNSFEEKWPLLYRMVWRLVFERRDLFSNPADPDVIAISRLAKQVSRDIHKMHAFVRFKKVVDEAGEQFVAWHEPDHHIVAAASSFFVRRFGAMRWHILTPRLSVHWDLETLSYSAGIPVQEAPKIDDAIEAWWETYYASTFNPARIKIKMMKKEMPVRYWKSMPETKLIPQLLADAPHRVQQMARYAVPMAAPPQGTLEEVKVAASCCQSCPLHLSATGTVFGVGPKNASVVLVGEQPGDEEDKNGVPFVGPAGQLLESLLGRAEMSRDAIYLTNAVKHFKWVPRGKKRLHAKPNGQEILACKPWITSELSNIRPKVIVCLGVTAAQSVLGQQLSPTKCEGQIFEGPFESKVMVTFHPSAALRAHDATGKEKICSSISITLVTAKQLAIPVSDPLLLETHD